MRGALKVTYTDGSHEYFEVDPVGGKPDFAARKMLFRKARFSESSFAWVSGKPPPMYMASHSGISRACKAESGISSAPAFSRASRFSG